MIGTKIKRSFAAMTRGWVACYGVLLAAILKERGLDDMLSSIWVAALYEWYAGLVIFMAWLLVFLPADVLVPETSVLRRPGIAALCGALGGCLPYVVVIGFNLIVMPNSFTVDQWWPGKAWLLVLAAPVTGLTAAFTLVRRYPRQPILSNLES